VLPQHPAQHSPERTILLAVDQPWKLVTSDLHDRATLPQIVGGNEPHCVGERGTARVEFEEDLPCEAPIM